MQLDVLTAAGCTKVFSDTASGAKAEGPRLNDALSYLRPGDTLVVWRLDRLGRSLKHLIEVVTEPQEREIGFRSLQESIDTTTSGGKLVFQIFGALAEFERRVIRERTRAGLEAARARGRKGGRPRKRNGKKEELLYRLYDGRDHSIADICALVGIARSTLYEYLNRRKAAAPPAAEPT